MPSLENSKGRVLIIDDELPLLQSYSQSLVASGFDVVEARRANEGLERLRTSDFDLILTDLVMPEMDGLKVVEQLRSGYPDIPVIVMFAEVDNQAAIQAAELGVTQVLIKPIAPEALEATANHAVRRHRSRPGKWASPTNDRGEGRQASSVTATEAKNEFGKILETVIRGNRVFITKHDARKAVLISVDDFNVLAASGQNKINTLHGEFDALLARMQEPGTRSKMKAAFNASPQQLGRAARKAAQKRG